MRPCSNVHGGTSQQSDIASIVANAWAIIAILMASKTVHPSNSEPCNKQALRCQKARSWLAAACFLRMPIHMSLQQQFADGTAVAWRPVAETLRAIIAALKEELPKLSEAGCFRDYGRLVLILGEMIYEVRLGL